MKKSYAVKQSNMLQGKAAFRAASVAGYQSVGAGGSFPLGALQIAKSCPGARFIRRSASARFCGRRGAGRPASRSRRPVDYVPQMNLYAGVPVLNGNVITIGFYSDSAGAQPAGTVKVTLPPRSMGPPTDPTSYKSYPIVIPIVINITVTFRVTETSGSPSRARRAQIR